MGFSFKELHKERKARKVAKNAKKAGQRYLSPTLARRRHEHAEAILLPAFAGFPELIVSIDLTDDPEGRYEAAETLKKAGMVMVYIRHGAAFVTLTGKGKRALAERYLKPLAWNGYARLVAG